MNASKPAKPEPIATANQDAACTRCGSFEVTEIAGQFLCDNCVALAGCGCAGDE